jgi:hypothetical protein
MPPTFTSAAKRRARQTTSVVVIFTTTRERELIRLQITTAGQHVYILYNIEEKD